MKINPLKERIIKILEPYFLQLEIKRGQALKYDGESTKV